MIKSKKPAYISDDLSAGPAFPHPLILFSDSKIKCELQKQDVRIKVIEKL